MYSALRIAFSGVGGLLIVYGIVMIFGNFLNSLLFFALGAVLLFLSRFFHPPEIKEAPPPDFDYTTDYRRETIMAKKQRLAALEEEEKKKQDAEANESAESAEENKTQ